MTQKISKSRRTQSAKKDAKATSATARPEREVDVLYQRIGSRWFAFSVIDDEVYMGSISDDSVINTEHRPFLNELK